MRLNNEQINEIKTSVDGIIKHKKQNIDKEIKALTESVIISIHISGRDAKYLY